MSGHGKMKNFQGYVKILVDGGNLGQTIYANRRTVHFEKNYNKGN